MLPAVWSPRRHGHIVAETETCASNLTYRSATGVRLPGQEYRRYVWLLGRGNKHWARRRWPRVGPGECRKFRPRMRFLRPGSGMSRLFMGILIINLIRRWIAKCDPL